MKLWGSIKQGAGKVAFDADKMMRVRKAESAIAALREKVEAQYVEAGRAAIALMAEGSLAHPNLQPFAQEVVRLQAEIKAEAMRMNAIQQEEFEPEKDEPEPAAPPVVPPAPSPMAAVPVEPPAPPAPEMTVPEEPAGPPPPPPVA